ncbi:hypothetical protein [Adlercreutzia mucosicola]|uniref:hypothetical protein n=1 Tax=Adlercreutzia mucosicola TaxID=580026 RepID=UPI00041E382D|nr:hypothetical protein [Adlercreutzia mucosicola]MCR2036245.1 hypothetical protein [Adlercreutzia mucosicola]
MAGEDSGAVGPEQEAAADPRADGGAQDEPRGADPEAEPDPEPEADQTDWKARSRQWESRAKAHKAKADEKDAEIASLKAQIARTGAVAEVAREKGVDAGLLARMAGDTPEEIAENADALLAFAKGPAFPDVPDAGGAGAAPVTVEDIEAIKDPAERVRARRDNIALYR